jgi:hypothetical protein
MMKPFDDDAPRIRSANAARAALLVFGRDRQLSARLSAAAVGVVLLFSPWAFGITGAAATWSAWVAGFALVGVGVVTAAEPVRWPDRLLLAGGVIVMALPWALGFQSDRVAMVCHACVGAAVIFVTAAHLARLDRSVAPMLRGVRRRQSVGPLQSSGQPSPS